MGVATGAGAAIFGLTLRTMALAVAKVGVELMPRAPEEWLEADAPNVERAINRATTS